MARSDDLAPTLAAKPAAAVGMRQGVVVAWDAGTFASQVRVGETVLENLPVLNSADAALISVGDAVTILTFGPSWLILGRIITP